MKKKLLAFFSSVLLSGCAANGLVTPQLNMENVEFKFTGIPIALGVQGTAVRLNERWVLTARHNKFMIFDNLIDHPVCDISVYRDDGELEAPMKAVAVKTGEAITTKGYAGWFAIPSEGKGKFVQYIDVTVDEKPESPSCLMASIDAPIWGGMSGGGAFTKDGNVIGINSMVYHNFTIHNDKYPILDQERYTAIVPICTEQVHSWLSEVTGETFCEFVVENE